MIIRKDPFHKDLYHHTERTYDLLYSEAIKKSYKYLKKYVKKAIFCQEGWWPIALQKIKNEGLCLEFGVFEGNTLNFFSNYYPEKKWYGFDSFYGLQEDWKGGFFAKGYFNLNGKVPVFNKNVTIIKGYFKKTLPIFFKKHNENISFIHIDCDTYQSTKEVFQNIKKNKLKKGCIILFDEYHGYINWENNEFKAWKEYVKKNKIKYRYIAFGEKQAVIEII
jgi:hypothetical protein